MVFVLLSPSKTLNFDQRRTGLKHTVPHFHDRALEIAAVMKKLKADDLAELMDISEKLATLNAARYKNFAAQETSPAILAFQGDTYVGLNAKDLSDAEITWSQNHIGILSGLYGLLRPLDLMQPYRLEMGTKVSVKKKKDLYDYWDSDITDHINALVKKHKLSAVIGCASNEYLSAVQTKALSVPFINCDFKENKNGKLQTIGLFAKRARGMMARFVVEKKITSPEEIRTFSYSGYSYDKSLSTKENFVFVR